MIYFLFPLLAFATCLFSEEVPKVLVSVAPYTYFVEKIAQDHISVNLMVPEASSAHTFEPTPKQMISATQSEIWFRIGEPFETKALAAIKSVRPELVVVDLRKGISLLHGQCKHAHAEGHCGSDLHLWLSPKIAKIQAKTIFEALVQQFPKHKEDFEKNYQAFINELTDLDAFISKTLSSVKNRILMVSHPAYAYFCKEYQFDQLPIEFEGRDPTGKQLTALLTAARQSQVHFILTQPQYSDKAARLIAQQINAQLISVDPYSEKYDSTLRQIATVIAENQ